MNLFPILRYKSSLVLVLTALSPYLAAQSVAGAASVTSPDHRLEMRFAVMRNGQQTGGSGALAYSVTYNDMPLVENSTLSLDLEGQPPLGTEVHLMNAAPGSGVDDYNPPAGKTSHVRDAWNSIMLTVAEAGERGRTMQVEARAYNDAVAFRYFIPEQAALTDFRLTREQTEFHIAKDATAWALYLPNFRSAYESEYLHLNISAFALQGGETNRALIGEPLLMHVPGVAWMAITEADLEDNAKMYLVNPPGGKMGVFQVQSMAAPHFDDANLAVVGALPHRFAWRVLLVGDEPGRLLESNVIEDLNPPSRIADTSWIHPGKTAWAWWSGNLGPDGKSANTTATMKYYVDFAAKSGFPYMLVDAGWSQKTNAPPGRGGANADITKMAGNVDIPELVRYAAKKGVKIWIWINYKPASVQMETAFPLYEKWGVVGVKIDFVERDDQQGIAFYYQAARVAAEHHLMVDFHGATTPWGLDRTFPNVLGWEAVMGMEYSKWSGRDNPIHRSTVAFTRMLDGPMDYTPGGFRNATEADFVPRNLEPMVLGTRAQQLALFVVDLAPFEMIPDNPAAYEGQPAFQFLRDSPVAWDETRVLQGYPAETITVARRKGRDWYLGSITNWTARDIHLPLDFLGSGKYTAQIYRDADDASQNPQHVSIEEKPVQQNETLDLHLAPGGGCAIHFIAKQ